MPKQKFPDIDVEFKDAKGKTIFTANVVGIEAEEGKNPKEVLAETLGHAVCGYKFNRGLENIRQEISEVMMVIKGDKESLPKWLTLDEVAEKAVCPSFDKDISF